VTVTLTKVSDSEHWGFRLAGGKDYGQPLSISQVSSGSLAADLGLKADDFLVNIDGKETYDLTHDQAEKAIYAAGNKFQMIIERDTGPNRKVSYEKATSGFTLKLGGGGAEVKKEKEAFVSNVAVTDDTPSFLEMIQEQDTSASVNFKKFDKPGVDLSSSSTLEDTSKPHMRKDWNCPWVRKDGRGLKQAIRALDGPTAPTKTSRQHFYSEPRSLLTPEPTLTQEELQKVIQEHGCNSRPDSKMELVHSESRSRPDSRQQQDFRQQQQIQENFGDQRQQEFTQMNGHGGVQMTQEYEDHYVKEETQTRRVEESYGRDREDDSQAPPPLETVDQDLEQLREAGYLNDMGNFDEESGYEPSADELIDVLKNLENLAAANPSLYKAIVEQIKVNTGKCYDGDRRSSSRSCDIANNNNNNTGKLSTILERARKRAKQVMT